jgi:hypothetical protein
MLPDPVTIAANSPNPQLVFALVNQDGYGSERRDTNGGGYTLKINHGKLKDGERHYMQILRTKAVTDLNGLVRDKTASVSLSMSVPSGFTAAEAINLVTAMTDTLADSEVTATKLIQWQS